MGTNDRFIEIAEVVEEGKAYTAAMLGDKFYTHVPPHIRSLMVARYMEEGMRSAHEHRMPMTRELVCIMTTEQEVRVAAATIADRMARACITQPPLPTPRLPQQPVHPPYAQAI